MENIMGSKLVYKRDTQRMPASIRWSRGSCRNS